MIEKRMTARMKIPKEVLREPVPRSKSDIRPLFTRITTHGSVLQRSPMISLMFPSLKDKIRVFHDDKINRKSVNTSGFVKRNELEKIIGDETRKRNASEADFGL